jgi:hypothetical protein
MQPIASYKYRQVTLGGAALVLPGGSPIGSPRSNLEVSE